MDQALDRASAVADALRFVPGETKFANLDTRATPGQSDKGQAATQLLDLDSRLEGLQERLWAESVGGGERRVVLVLQGMDTSGKDGTIRQVTRSLNPQGVAVYSFKAPTAEERRHDFLWRIENAVAKPGYVGIFNRSHYEDVLIVRVHKMVPEEELSTRYERINEFEHRHSDDGVVWVKCMLHISPKAQKERLLARLDDPTKYWKYNAADLAERARWGDYSTAYSDALEKCTTDVAPWYVVPSDSKWYRNWAVAHLLLGALETMALQYPPADFNVAEQRRLVEAAP